MLVFKRRSRSLPGRPRRGRPMAVAAGASARRGLVVGCGSNVVDLFFPLRQFPEAGEKTYFAQEQFCSSRIVGGVTLNHLAWARALGCPTALLALQGNDENGRQIRAKLRDMGVSTEYIRSCESYTTAVSHILSTPDGERTIIMAPGSTSSLTRRRMEEEFSGAVHDACMVTTEISQLPLSGVRWLLESARRAGHVSMLDVDVTPEVALTAAQLGSKEDLVACVTQASVVKLTRGAAGELLSLVSGEALDSTLEGASHQLARALKARLCVITDGSRGSSLALGPGSEGQAVMGDDVAPVQVPPYPGITQVDATGAGDAFFGALVACLHAAPRTFPESEEELQWMGKVASAAGAACVEVQGALPVAGVSAARVLQLCPAASVLVRAAEALDVMSHRPQAAETSPPGQAAGSGPAFRGSLRADSEAAASLAAAKQQDPRDVARAVELLLSAHVGRGADHAHVYTSGVGKSGLVASRMAASLRSVGVRASYVPGSEWAHGDLGTVRRGDVLVAFSHSGGTVEMVGAAHWFKARQAHVLAVTGKAGGSSLSQAAEAHLLALAPQELLGLVPTRSIVAQEMVVNGLLTAVSEATGLTLGGFRENHPGGSIGSSAGQGEQP